MHAHPNVYAPTHMWPHTNTNIYRHHTYVKKKKKDKKEGSQLLLEYTRVRGRPGEHDAEISGVSELRVEVYSHGWDWVTFSCRSQRFFWKTEEIWVPSKPSYLSITKVDPFKFAPPEFKKCHSATVLLQELRRVVYKHPRDSWQSFIRHLIKSLIKCKSSSRLMKRRSYGIDVWLLPILWYSFNVLLISYDYSTS